jgi:ornithine cyclodeaminase/alanine dehydrogenase
LSNDQPIFLSDADLGGLLDWRAAVQSLARAYALPIADAMVPPRSQARGDGQWLRGLSAISPSGRHMGSKLIAASMKSRQASYLVSLFDQHSTALVALLDGNRITGVRTAATAALFIDRAAPRRFLRVAVLGSGFEARSQLAALAAVRDIAQVSVFSPTPASRERFAQDFRDSAGLRMQAAASAQQAVQDSDVVICAARSRDESPVLQGKWLAPGMTVTSIGSTLPEQREVDAGVIESAALIVADMRDEVAQDTGDMLAATAAGVDFEPKLVTLADVIGGRRPVRTHEADIVV